MAERGTEQLIIGALMRNPKVLLQKDRYQIDINDFDLPLYQYVFYAIYNMAQDGVLNEIPVPEIENWLGKESRGRDIYEGTTGRQVLVDALEQARETGQNFESLYKTLKKQNLIRDLKRNKFNTDEYFIPDAKTDRDKLINDKYNELEADDILTDIEHKLINIRSKYTNGERSESQTLFSGLMDLISGYEDEPEFGLPLQGSLFNHAVSGAITKRVYLRAGSSGIGKTRQIMGDACHMAFPIRYSWEKRKWINVGTSKKVLVIITEQSIEEVQKMAAAYVSGINEGVFKKGLMNAEQKEIMEQAYKVLAAYEDNFIVSRVPSPSIALIKQTIREEVALHNMEYVFFDYIFESPALYAEFPGLRTDQMLFLYITELKNVAVELDIFLMTSMQLNAKADDNKSIRNESALAGSRATINKADMGCIMTRPSVEELKVLEEITNEIGVVPNIVTDIFKNRGDEYTQIRIWSYMDLGVLRKTDLFVTDSHLRAQNLDYSKIVFAIEEEEATQIKEMLEGLNGERV